MPLPLKGGRKVKTLAAFTMQLPRDTLLNANQRYHWAKRSQKTRDLRAFGKHLAHDFTATYGPFRHQVRATVTLEFPDTRRRDPANWAPTAKALIDGMVTAGLLIDDDYKHLVGPDMRIRPGGETFIVPGRVMVTVSFEGDEQERGSDAEN